MSGLAAAHDAGVLPADRSAERAGPAAKEAARARFFSDAMAKMMALRPAQVASIAPETVVCRCEDVTRGEIDGAHEAGARDLNQLKHFTRCGMGPCQGRMCGDVAAELLAAKMPATKIGSREQVGCWTGRPPLRPVGFDDLIGALLFRHSHSGARAAVMHDLAVIGGGVHGATVALFAARGGMDVALLERGAVCREASGVNAGTLTMQMTRVALIPYALRAHAMWASAGEWLGHDVGVVVCDGLSLAFTEREEELLTYRAGKRREAGAPIALVTGERARQIEPGLGEGVRLAGHCRVDGFANAYLTGLAYRRALLEAGVALHEDNRCPASNAKPDVRGPARSGPVRARRIVLAGGV